jgi:hypothetical protein
MPEQDVLFARVKPYNPKRGHVCRRVIVLGTLWEGGSGVPPDTIPTWTKVNAAQAQALKACKQVDNDAYSQRIFDIVTAEQRAQIDHREEQYRKSIMGYGASPTIGELPDVSARDSSAIGGSAQPLNADGSRMTLADLQNKTAVPVLPLADDDDEIGGLQDMQPEKTPQIKAHEKDMTGRFAASSDFPSSEDLNADAEDDEADVSTVAMSTTVPPPKGKGRSRGRGK